MSEVGNKILRIGYVLLLPFLLLLVSGFDRNRQQVAEGMVRIPEGQYTPFYKSEGDTTVKVEAFLLDVHAVTNAEFLEFVKANPKWAKSQISSIYGDSGYLKHWESDFDIGPSFSQIKNSPVTNVSWYAANAYCKWRGKRLPTIYEWEYAGSAAIESETDPIEKVILNWYSKPTPALLPPVESTYKNSFDLYDMHGLVWEWVYDFNSIVMDGDSRSNTAIKRQLFCASGSFGAANQEDYAAFMRFAYRGSLKANYTVNNLGFRCAKSLD